MGTVDHADDAVNHRIPDSNHGISAADRQPVNELLNEIQEILHGCRTPMTGPRLHKWALPGLREMLSAVSTGAKKNTFSRVAVRRCSCDYRLLTALPQFTG